MGLNFLGAGMRGGYLFYPEDHLGPQTNLIACPERCGHRDARSIYEGAVGTPIILHEPLPIPQGKPGMQARNGIIRRLLKVFFAHSAPAYNISIFYGNLDVSEF